MRDRFFRIQARSLISGDWGDYGDILQHGITRHLPRIDGKLALERTGPFIPPITFPGIGDILLTDNARSLLASSGLTGFTFQPVEKSLIVRLNWEQWDLTAAEPRIYPEEGEPENYILGHGHSEETAAELGQMWELVAAKTVGVAGCKPDHFDIPTEFRIDSSTWDGNDVFRSPTAGGTYLTERGQSWISERWSQFVEFEECLAD